MTRHYELSILVEDDRGGTRVVTIDHITEGDARGIREALRYGGFNANLICTEVCEVVVE